MDYKLKSSDSVKNSILADEEMMNRIYKLNFWQRFKLAFGLTKHAKEISIYGRYMRSMVVLFILSIIIAGILIYGLLILLTMGSDVVKVPEVRGQNVVDASIMVEANTLQVEIEKIFDERVPKFSVMDQFPKPGISVKQGRTVKLLISMGKDVYIVPQVSGLSRPQAEQILHENNIPFEVSVIQSSDYPTNTVISQNFKVGSEVERSEKLVLLVNSDVYKGQYRILDYRKKPVDYVVRTLFENGIVPTINNVQSGKPEEDGIVIGQNVPENTVVEKNSSIKLDVGVFGGKKYTYCIFKYFLTRSDVPMQVTDPGALVRVSLYDEMTQHTEIYNSSVPFDSWVVVTFKTFGLSKVSLIVNEALVKEMDYGSGN